jgi:hypothetical protein
MSRNTLRNGFFYFFPLYFVVTTIHMTRGMFLALLVLCSVIGAYAHSPMPLLGLVSRSRPSSSHRAISHHKVCL